MLLIEKNLTIYFSMVRGNLLLVSIEILFLNYWKKITAEYFTKFTNASYENILFNFNDFTITKMIEVPWDKEQRVCVLKLFGLACLREEILLWRRHYPEVLKLMVNNYLFVSLIPYILSISSSKMFIYFRCFLLNIICIFYNLFILKWFYPFRS